MSETIEYRETTMMMTAVYSTSQGNLPPGEKLEGLFVSHVRAEQFARTFRSLTSDGWVRRDVAVTVSEKL